MTSMQAPEARGGVARRIPPKRSLDPRRARQAAPIVRVGVEGGPHRGVSRADVRRRAVVMLAALQMRNQELSILLTGDDQIALLNGLYRKKRGPTDVLAFAQREGPLGDRAGAILGDVVISVPTARRQAAERSADLTSEMTMLLAHGILHLLGWDHDTPSKDRRMRRETERLCGLADRAAPGPVRRSAAVKGATRPEPIAIRRR
jgi:probable rRNA maturation factor